MKCYCGNNLVWGGDAMYDECGMDGEGVVSNLSCFNEDCLISLVLVHTDISSEKKLKDFSDINELRKQFTELEKRYMKLSEEFCNLKMRSNATRY